MNEKDRVRKQASYYKLTYPPGTRIHLNNMDDPYSPVPAGTKGTVESVDDMGQIHMAWDNGRTLAIIPGVDSFRQFTDKELEEEKQAASLKEKIESASSRIAGDPSRELKGNLPPKEPTR